MVNSKTSKLQISKFQKV